MSATATPPGALDDPKVRGALDRTPAVVQRALMRIMEHEERAARAAAAESPPAVREEGVAPSKATPSDAGMKHPDQRVSACPSPV
jgi:hypothetical protein